MTENKLIYSVKDIFTIYLDGEYKYYNIPEYQRGYKWNAIKIEQLLNDIDKFNSNGNDERFYCIQNITIVEKEIGINKFYNVVDGQQRLTTLMILLSYLGQSELVKGKIKYSVRPDTDNFIKLYIIENKINYSNWEDFLNDNTKSLEIADYNHQDIYYIFNAYKTIKNWFENRNKEQITDKLLNNVKLIVNKLDKGTKEQELFMNLNTGQVSLDGADLVRAMLITNVAKEEIIGKLDETKNIVRLNEKRVRIGLEIDEISAWWSQAEVREYFKWLNKIKVPDSESIQFDSNIYHIDLLYKLFIAKKGENEIKLRDFEYGTYFNLLSEIIHLHRTIKDWYQDCEIYHFIGYIMNHTDISFKTIWDKWENSYTRENFTNELKEKVKGTFIDSINQINKIDEDWFENNNLYKTLIICDIIQIINSQKTENRLHFLDAPFFNPNKEDIEHIFPQTPIGQRNTTPDDFKSYISLLKNIDDTLLIDEPNWDNSEEVEQVKNKINNSLRGKININSIGNLCLLNNKVNRSFGNDFFTKKRFTIIRNTKFGKHIRPHTLNCFDKSFYKKSSEGDYDVWTNEDIKVNAEYIKTQIISFFQIN
ncbi:MAG: DUF262 domain-containing protein [Bacteroidales bacterium]|nr:DUF262 domain-containing protein [Bacteroidales bacterium]